MPDRRPPVQWHQDATPPWPAPTRLTWTDRCHAMLGAWPLIGLLGLWVLAGLVEGGTDPTTVLRWIAGAALVAVTGCWLAGMFDTPDQEDTDA